MLNLVQVQERLKDVPMQALMAYANGSNPQIPPFLALGELNRRKKMQEGAAAEQAQEMEGAPTIKQQIEQQAGLMALQGSRQRQAAQQQQQVQSAMPMAAPNTTTSEPAQLAAGGFIDDIVVPRDYQAGGKVDPEMLKRLMMRRAMQGGVRGMGRMPVPSGGISSLVPRKYRGGGPVAFQGGGGPIGRAPYEEDERERLRRALREQGISTPIRTEAEATPAAREGIAAVAPEDMFKGPEKRSFDEMLAERQRRQEKVGIDRGYLDRYGERLDKLEAIDTERQAGQPMDQLLSFLTGIAGSRRGAGFGEAGSAGVKSSMQLKSEQEALNRKLAGEMASLRLLADEKRQALLAGDMAAVEKLEADEAALRRQAQKDKIEHDNKQRQLDINERQVRAYEKQASRPTEYDRNYNLYLQHTREVGEKPTAQGFQRFMLGARASTVMTMEDAIRIATQQLSAGAIEPPSMDAIRQRARELMVMAGNQAPGGSSAAPLAVDPSKVQGLPAGSKLGSKTEKGIEVFDSKGKLIGHIKE